MMKISVKLDKRYRLANGKYAVKLSVSRLGKTFYVPIGVEVAEEDWDSAAKNQNYVKNVRDKNALNMYIRSRLAQAEQAVRDLQLKGTLRQYDNKKLIAILSNERTSEKRQLFSYQAEQCLKSKPNKDSVGTYESAIKALSRHYDYESLAMQDIDKRLIEELFKKLKDEGLKTNTIIGYINRIRTIYNYAYDNGDVSVPLPKMQFKREQTKKRSLVVEQVRQLMNMKTTRRQKEYIDIFILMLYMRGINMKDLSELMLSDIHANYLEYIRDKTGKHLQIKLEPEILEIIEKYKGTKHLLRFFDGHKPSEEYHKKFGNLMITAMRNAAVKNGIMEPISAYWSRHTWSSLAIEIGIDIAYVSAGLSHSHGAPVTQVYVQYRQKRIDEDSRKVIDYILQKGEFEKKS